VLGGCFSSSMRHRPQALHTSDSWRPFSEQGGCPIKLARGSGSVFPNFLIPHHDPELTGPCPSSALVLERAPWRATSSFFHCVPGHWLLNGYSLCSSVLSQRQQRIIASLDHVTVHSRLTRQGDPTRLCLAATNTDHRTSSDGYGQCTRGSSHVADERDHRVGPSGLARSTNHLGGRR